MLQIVVMYALFASIFTVGKTALLHIPPFYLTAIRYFFAGACLYLWEWKKGTPKDHPLSKEWLLIVAVGCFGVFLTNGLEFWGLQFMSSGKTCLLYSLSPFFSMLFAYLFLHELMTVKKLLGLLIGFLGFGILISSPLSSQGLESEGVFPSFSLAEIAVTGSALFSVFGWIFFKKLTFIKKYPINLANAHSFFVGGGISLGMALVFEEVPRGVLDLSFLFQLCYIAVVHSIICFTLYAHALQRHTVTFLMFAGVLNPIFTAFYGWLFLGESVTIEFVLCLIFVSMGLRLFAQEERKQH